jgi:hypothetical protein
MMVASAIALLAAVGDGRTNLGHDEELGARNAAFGEGLRRYRNRICDHVRQKRVHKTEDPLKMRENVNS